MPETKTERIEFLIEPSLLRKLDNARGELPRAIFLRKLIKDSLSTTQEAFGQ